jgi:hypothetical protein
MLQQSRIFVLIGDKDKPKNTACLQALTMQNICVDKKTATTKGSRSKEDLSQ